MALRLKSIELQGYKTFANKVRFEFPARITAIVGPNGSGKSNISDSIRWVLGEQSYSLLRGRKTMDMIFTGSEQKARAGMASVSILFDNQDHWLPIDYEEVSITRRAFRDGDNEYAINGQKVRLKDINELLGQSGLAERTYTVIGQGLIDNALSLKPDDRRKFFEEAAGIGLFRSRREEALERLDVTRRNMERIGDILGELEPRIHSLERQAKKAREYEQIKQDLKSLLREWYGYHWHKSQQLLISAMNQHAVQEEKTNQTRLEFAEFDNHLTALQEKVRTTRLNLSQLHNRLSDTHHQLEQSNRSSAILAERLTTAKNQLAEQLKEIDSTVAELAILENRKKTYENEIIELQKSCETALQQKDLVEQELQGKQSELKRLQNERTERRNSLTKIEASLIRLNARKDELQNQMNSLTQSIEKLKVTLEDHQSNLASIRNESTRYSAEFEKTELSLKENLQKQNQIRDTLQSLDKQRSGLLAEQNKAEVEFSRCAAQIEVIKNADQSFAGLNQGAQFLIKVAKQGKLRQNLRSLGSLFIIPKQYEIAAASALGDHLDAILMEPEDLNYAMDLLCSGENGRAVMISEAFHSECHSGQNNPALESLPCLIDLIQFDETLHSIAERLFGNVYLAESRKQAMKLQSELQPDQMIVTLSGDTFRANGSIISGNENRHLVLSRPREKQELQEKMAAAQEKAAQHQNAIKDLDLTIELTRKENQEISVHITEYRAALDTIQKKMSQYSMEIQKQEQTIAFQNQRIREYEKQIQAACNTTTQDDSEILKLEKERNALQETIHQLTNSMHQIQLDELQNQLHHWTLEWTVTDKSIRETQFRIADLNAQIQKNQQKKQLNETKVAEINHQIDQMIQNEIEIRKESEEINLLSKSIEAEIAPEEIVLAKLEEEHNTAQAEFQAFQIKLSAAEKAFAQSQIDVTRNKDQLEILRKQIEDDFGLVAFDYCDQIQGQTPLPLGDWVDKLPIIESLPPEMEEQITRQKAFLYRMGSINPESITEYKTVNERYLFLKTQKNDLEKAAGDLRKVINELDEMMKNAFQKTFEKVQIEFATMFTRLFNGGSAKLILTDPDDPNQSGIDIEAKLPGHREQELSLLSGGERSLTSVALVFALLRVNPTPFCVMDEVDAALDEANVGRFCELLKELSQETQFIVITHNRNTVETADVIYGITMGRDSASQSVSLRLDQVSKEILN
jgi:chromosome segregation protein